MMVEAFYSRQMAMNMEKSVRRATENVYSLSLSDACCPAMKMA